MIPARLTEDTIHQINLCMWAEDDPAMQAKAALQILARYATLFGRGKVSRLCGLQGPTMDRYFRQERSAKLETVTKLLAALGLRFRIERDPNPRQIPLKPQTRRVQQAVRQLDMDKTDATGAKARQEEAADIRRRRANARSQAKYHARRKAEAANSAKAIALSLVKGSEL